MKKIKKSEIGERIRVARIEALLTQQEVANLLGLKTDASVTNMESGRQDLTITQMHKLARVLRVDPIWLVFGIKQEPPQKTVLEMASLGGKTASANMSKEQKTARAKKAATKRWSKNGE